MENREKNIYIKIKPDKYTLEEAQLHNIIGNKLSKGEKYKVKIPGDINTEHMDEFLICIKDKNGSLTLQNINYYNVETFNEFSMLNVTDEELKEKFITLYDLIKTSEFVGKWGRIMDPDTDFQTAITDYRIDRDLPIVLYEGDTHVIILQRKDEEEFSLTDYYQIEIIDKIKYPKLEYSDITQEEKNRRPGLEEFLEEYKYKDVFCKELYEKFYNKSKMTR